MLLSSSSRASDPGSLNSPTTAQTTAALTSGLRELQASLEALGTSSLNSDLAELHALTAGVQQTLRNAMQSSDGGAHPQGLRACVSVCA